MADFVNLHLRFRIVYKICRKIRIFARFLQHCLILSGLGRDQSRDSKHSIDIMKKVFILMAVVAMCFAACAKKQKSEQGGPRHGGGMEINKDSDSTFVALKNETLTKFKQLTFEDAETGKTMEYNLLVPEGYDGTKSFPLLLFMADASTVGKEVTAPLTQGYGALVFASDRDQQKHPSFVLVPQYTEWAVQDDWSTTDEVEMTTRLLPAVCEEYKVDTNRLYTTGQSMGGMMSFYFNIAHPDLFAA